MGRLTTKPLEWTRRGECIIVTSHKPTGGRYCNVKIKGKNIGIHRIVCERRHGPLGDLFATHSCDTPNCINPNHLTPGTSKQNMEGAIARGRTLVGARNHNTKISEAQVREIRASKESLRSLAERYGVHFTTISDIKNGHRRGSVC